MHCVFIDRLTSLFRILLKLKYRIPNSELQVQIQVLKNMKTALQVASWNIARRCNDDVHVSFNYQNEILQQKA